MRGPSVVRVGGPLAPYAAGFGAHLLERGYAPSSAEDQLRLMAHLSRWLEEQRQEPAALTPELVRRFLDARRAGYVKLASRRALTPLLDYLRGLDVVRDALVEPSTAVDGLLADYREYLVRERGLAPGTVRLREQAARLFLVDQPEPLELALQRLEPGDVTRFVLAECRSGRRGVASAKTLTSSLRSLLSFLHLAGWVPVGLAPSVPSVAGWRLASLPRALKAADVERLLGSCDTSTALGRRDLAILTLLARLGLRSFEVAGLSLDDIDWRAGELTIRGKGSVSERLPLPDDVGRALVEHLRAGLPRGSCRGGVPPCPRAAARDLRRGGALGRASRLRPCWACAGRRSPAASHRRQRPVACGRSAAADRAGAASRERGEHLHIREDRPLLAADAGAAVAA